MGGAAVTGRVEHRAGSEVRQLRTEANKLNADAETLRKMQSRQREFGTEGVDNTTLLAELVADHATLVTWLAEVDGDLDDINDYLDRLNERDGVLFSNLALISADDAGSDIDFTALGICVYRISGQVYVYEATGSEAHQLAGTGGTGAGEILDTKWGAWRITLDALGAIGSDPAMPDDSAKQNYSSEQDALLSLASSPRGAGEVDIYYVTVDANGDWTTGADDPVTADAKVTVANYYQVFAPMTDNGLTAAPSVGIAISAGPTEVQFGTINVRQNAKNYAQIAADTDFTETDADIVTDNLAGGWMLVVDRAGTAVVSLSADGIAEITTQAYADDAAVIAALTNAIDRLPVLFTVVGSWRVVIDTLGGDFTLGTTSLADAAVTDVYVDELSTAWDRTTAGDAQPRGLPSLPATVTSPLVASLTAAAPVAREGCGLAVDGNVQDIQMTRPIMLNWRGIERSMAATDPIDISSVIASASTITLSTSGVLWVYGNIGSGAADVKAPTTSEGHATDIAALAQPLPSVPNAGDVPIGVVMATVDASEWTWGDASAGRLGTDSTVETYYDLINQPFLYSALASFALDTAGATFTYGAAKGVLGNGANLTITGKANVAFPAGEITAVNHGKFGAWILYALADDDEIPLQVGADYASLQAAKTAVDDLIPNPLLIELGRIYIQNQSGAVFTPATTLLDATGISVTFESAVVPSAYKQPTDLTGATVNA